MRFFACQLLAITSLASCGGTTAQPPSTAVDGGDGGAREESIDESKLGKPCTSSRQCKGGTLDTGCVGFPEPYGYRCTTNACEVLTCPAGLQCTVYLTEPGSVGCAVP